MQITLDGCRTMEQCLGRYADWLTERARTDADLSEILSSIADCTGETVEVIHSAMGIILNAKGEVLLLRRSKHDRSYPDSYSFPGGRADEAENDLGETIVRETLQETGLLTRVRSLHSVRYTTIPERKRIYRVAVYLLDLANDSSPIQLSDEHDDFVWALPATVLREKKKIPLSGSIIEDLVRELASDKSWPE